MATRLVPPPAAQHPNTPPYVAGDAQFPKDVAVSGRSDRPLTTKARATLARPDRTLPASAKSRYKEDERSDNEIRLTEENSAWHALNSRQAVLLPETCVGHIDRRIARRGGIESAPVISAPASSWAESTDLNQHSPPRVGFCPYRKSVVSVRRKMHLSLIFLEILSEMDLEVLGLPSKISAERAVLRVLSEESSRECPMRIAFDPQRRFDCPPVLEVRLNTSCRDEIIPILKGLQHIYSQPELRDELLDAVAQDVNGTSSADLGRPGMTYWSILVLGAVRLGCNFDYDRLQNLAEEHRSLRQVMGIGGWCDDQTFDWRCLRDNICLLSPDTIERVNHLIVAEGHRLVPEAAETVRGDSFVPATNIHYPTDSSLIGDGLRTIVPLAVRLARLLGLGGWRQRKHLLRTVKKQLRAINKIAKGKGRDFPKRLQDGYRTLLDLADRILARGAGVARPRSDLHRSQRRCVQNKHTQGEID